MSDSLFPPFLKWGQYKSKEKENPDTIKIRVKELETFETEYSINVEAEIFENNKWNTIVVPLKSHESKNSSLLNQWTRGGKDDIIKIGDELTIETYLDKSRNNRPIRRFSLGKT